MKRKIAYVVVLLVLFGGIVNAQSEKDGLSKINQKEFGAAKQIFSKILKSDPKNATALYGMGECYRNMGKIDSAKVFFQNGIDASSSNAYNYAGLGKISFLSNPVAAEEYFKNTIKKSKKDAGAIISIANFYYELSPKKLDEAKRYVELAIGIDSKNASAYVLNGIIELDKSDASKAALQFDRAIYFDPSQMEAYLYASKIMASTRNISQAVGYINSAISVNADYWPAYKSLGELYYDNQKYADAVTNFAIYFKNVPNDKDITHYAYSLFFNKQYQEARDMIDKLIKQNPNDYVLLRLSGYISYETKDLVNGKAIMDKFFSLVPPDKVLTDDYSYYGKMLSAAGNDSLAIVNYNLALKKDSTEFQLYDEITKSYKKLKKYDLALEYGNKFINKKPNILTGDYFNLGLSYYISASSIVIKKDSISQGNKVDSVKQINYYHTADSLFAKVEKNSPDSYLGPLWRGRVNAVIDSENAGLPKPHYEKALAIVVKDTTKYKKEVSEIYNYLGIYYFKHEENDSSMVYMKKLLELDPANTNALTVIQEIEKEHKKK